MTYLSSAIGRKQIMAVTGLAWAGFVMAHMLGNLLIFVGPDAYNKYSYAITSGPLLYIAEAGLLLTLAFHVYDGFRVTAVNRSARKQKYAMATNGEKSARFQSKWMAVHGPLILAFLIWHLITFKYGPYYSTNVGGVEMRDLHRLIMEVFQNPAYVAGYVVCMVLVGLHLSHGFYSSFATLGLYHPKYSRTINKIGFLYAAAVALGFIAQPLYVFAFAH